MGVYELRLPELGEGLHEGRIGKWLVKQGDVIKEDDAVAEVENDKALVELPSPVDGKILEIKVTEGTVAVVGDILMTLEVAGEGNASASSETAIPASDSKVAPVEESEEVEPAAPRSDNPESTPGTPATTPTTPTVSAAHEVLATPGVRKHARDAGVDIAQVNGTGAHGKITKEDVDQYVSGDSSSASVPEEGEESAANPTAETGTATTVVAGSGLEERIALTTIRKKIAEAMAKSAYTAPHVTLMDEVNVTELVEFRTELKPLAAERGVKITYLPFIVKALVAATRLHPQLNATLDEEKGELVLKKYYNIGIATDTDRGLLVPVVRDADRKNMWSIAAEIEDLATRGRSSKLTATELKGSTISITNIGSAGGMFFTPIINYPEVAILGVGRITEKPIMKQGQVVGAQMMALSLSFDHRIIDGALAQHFINDVKRLLENPRVLLMEV